MKSRSRFSQASGLWGILAIDIVGYSDKTTEDGRKAIQELTDAVRSSNSYACGPKGTFFLPTGDGMIVGFSGNHQTPLALACEVHRRLKNRRSSLKMGIASGHVVTYTDITGRENYAGAAVNRAVRLESCCDGGHILVEASVAEDLKKLKPLRPTEKFDGPHEFEVKHGEIINACNVFDTAGAFGNSKEPEKNRRKEPAKSGHDLYFKTTTICLKHRINARERYYESAFRSGGDVLYIAIMSQGTLKDMKRRLETARATSTTIRVLTWHAATPPAAVELFRRHLGENEDCPDRTLKQLQQAAADWHSRAKDFSNLTVREFRSAPTMQGLIVGNRWAVIELMPFHTYKDDRPALILTPQANPELFSLFKERFEALWKDAEESPSQTFEVRKGPNL